MAAYIHRRTFRVVMSEVDVAQIHFTNAFRWMDRGLSEWLAEIGHPFTSVLETGPGIPIVDARCAFLGRILLDDVIEQTTEVGGLGRTSFRSRHAAGLNFGYADGSVHFIRQDIVIAVYRAMATINSGETNFEPD